MVWHFKVYPEMCKARYYQPDDYECKRCIFDARCMLRKALNSEELTNEEWLALGEYMLNVILDEIDYYAWNIHDSPLDAISAYSKTDFYEACNDFLEEEVVEVIKRMPDEIYDAINRKYQEILEHWAEEFKEEFTEEEN